MVSLPSLVTLCALCQQVYDSSRGAWMKLKDYRAHYGEPSDGYVFTETFCDGCHKLYATMIGTRKEEIEPTAQCPVEVP